ncbi:MAG: glucans biosynthesis glucosyltransferase MdoH [Paracoccaceae bacterium]
MSLAETFQLADLPVATRPGIRTLHGLLTAGLTLAITLSFAVSIPAWNPAAVLALVLVALTALWISGGASTALVGIARPDPDPADPPAGWTPQTRTAILVTMCKEPPEPLARHLAALRASLDRAHLGDATRIFLLSDTSGTERIAEEARAFDRLHANGLLHYRRRARNTGRKPGNIADWLAAHGDEFDFMLVLDADSRMTARRIRRMIWQMERRPALGLLQAGIALVPGTSRFGRHQRVSSRLLSRTFGRGFAAWTGESGNYWGHNALIRVAAFRSAAELPVLSGRPPLGGAPLSHDFIEAAWMRRAGWAVALDPDPSGSGEDAPQTVAAFHARDRRWCQGNLQHLRLIAEPGLAPLSRVHLASGVLSYLVAPAWLILLAVFATGAVQVSAAAPLAAVGGVLLAPKLCALGDWLRRTRTAHRRLVVLRAWFGELLQSSLVAPLIMLRQAGAVAAVLLGRDCGWKSGGGPGRALPPGLPEMAAGAALLAVAIPTLGPLAIWLAPVALPLCGAPWIIRALDGPA